MILIGNYFAIALVMILCLFFFDSKHFPTKTSKYFAIVLILTLVTSALDIFATSMLTVPGIPPWVHIATNSAYFAVNIFTTAGIAMVLFSKILEHVYDDHCMKRASFMLNTVSTIYFTLIAANAFTGWIFYIDESGAYRRGPINSIGYAVTFIQMVLVLICYVRNRRSVDAVTRRALFQTIPIVAACISLQLFFPDVLMNGLIMSLVDTVIYLNFQNQRPGKNALTKLNDRHRFLSFVEEHISSGRIFKVYLIYIKNLDSVDHKYGNTVADEILYLFAFGLEKRIKNSTTFQLDSSTFVVATQLENRGEHNDHLESLRSFLNGGVVYKDEVTVFDCQILENTLRISGRSADLFLEELQHGLDIMTEAKENYLIYTPEMTEAMLRRRHIISKLETVDLEHGYELWFQPIRCAKDGSFSSAEALIRLRDTTGEFISPGEFIPVAERADMINPITWFVISEACRVLSSSPELDGVSISINMPMRQLLEEEFEEKLDKIVDNFGISHERIGIEFTERSILENFELSRDIMERISCRGYRFLLDDFGSGFSNFNCLLSLPFSRVKLDKSLTDTVDGKNAEVVRMLTDFFHKANLEVIAEGVETAEQVAALTSYGVDKIQGYHFAAPMSHAALLDFYRENKA